MIDARAKLEGERAEKFTDLKEFLKRNSQKSGNANTLRMAVDMAHDKIGEIKQEKANIGEKIETFERRKKAYIP